MPVVEPDTSPARRGTADRVRAQSGERLNHRVDRETRFCLEHHASADRVALTEHLAALDREWDVERYLQTNAGLVTFTGLLLGATVHRGFLAVSGLAFGFFLQHAVQGWCPPVPIFRRMGVRTRREINREKYALKALRGDFETLEWEDAPRER